MKLEKQEATILLLLILILQVLGNDYTISTRLGQIKGTIIQNDTDTIYQFKSIPYAKPPVASLRFRKPEAFGSWSGVLDGTQFSLACKQTPQFGFETANGEDCLYLNVYVPNSVSQSNRSVMFWIHGGGLTSGSATFYDGSKLALTGNVIVVTINYRLGIFGFVSSGDTDLPGNYGLWDQRLALEWVKNNIADFGGNPSSITIFGESAGGWSVGFHTLNPLNDGLFQRAIFQSGTANADIAMIKEGNLNSVARYGGCTNSKTTTEIVDCLRSKSADDLLQVASAVEFEAVGLSSKFLVGVDGVFVPDEPKKLFHDVTSPSYKFFRSLDIIVGTTDGEGSLFLALAPYIFPINVTLGITTKTLCDMFCPLMANSFFNGIQTVSMATCDKYKVLDGDTTNMAEQGRQLTNLYGDLLFVAPSIETLNFHSDNNLQTNSFQYLFTRDVSRLLPPPEWFSGAHHAAELSFIFASPQFPVTSEDIKLSETMMKYWTNFAKNGNPNIGLPVPTWQRYTQATGRYMQLDIQTQEKAHLFQDRMQFWLDVVPGIINPVVRTHSGSVRGIAVQYSRKTVSHFRGIPYAKPPVGNLRFARPQPVAAWEDILDATRYPPSCMQQYTPSVFAFLPNKEFSEDCLYMNIYVPGRISAISRKPVMIWIHGGGYITGQATAYDGSAIAEKGDVIVVAMNYRLGVFGFMSTDNGILKGNYGLWDQKMAMEWVKHNIAAFGGDPSSITIFGESAGGFSVSLQAISPLNQNLFQRVIAQSGTSLADMVVSKSPPNMLVLYGNALNCSTAQTSIMLECVRRMPAKALDDLFTFMYTEHFTRNKIPFTYEDIPWKPTVDGELIPDDPRKLLKDASSKSYQFFRSLDLMTGTTSGEGSLMFQKLNFLNIDYTTGISTSDLCNVIAPGHAFNLNNQNVSSKKICNKYKVENGNTTNRILQGRQVVNLYGDKYFVSTAIEILNLHSRFNFRGRSYQYLFSRQLPSQLEIITPVPAWFEGSTHGTDVIYMFGAYQLLTQLLNIQASQKDIQLGEKTMEYWTNFAKTGNPNSANLTNWPQYTNKEKKYLEFGSDAGISEKKMLWSDRMKFWFDLSDIPYVLYEPVIDGAPVPYPAVALLLLCCISVMLNFFE